MRQRNSRQLFDRAKSVIYGGTQTLSKQPAAFDAEFFPAFIERGQGCRLWDADGNCFVDFLLALGPVVLGYNNAAVNRAICGQLESGILFTGNSGLEIELAEKLIDLIPNADRVRFFKTGAEAVSAAVRLARHFTGRELVVSCGYHGWHDWAQAKNNESGIPLALREKIINLPYGDAPRLREIVAARGRETACFVIEPVQIDFDFEFLREAEELARACGAILIYDEIITGFRIDLGGCQKRFGVTADLAVFGKAIANGMPLSVVTGRKEIFDAGENLWISTTYGGETLSLKAALTTINELEKGNVIEEMWRFGADLTVGWNATLEKFPCVEAETNGIGSLPVLKFRRKCQEDFFTREMLRRGFIVRRSNYWFTSQAHTDEDIAAALAATEEVFSLIEK